MVSKVGFFHKFEKKIPISKSCSNVINGFRKIFFIKEICMICCLMLFRLFLFVFEYGTQKVYSFQDISKKIKNKHNAFVVFGLHKFSLEIFSWKSFNSF